MSHWITMKKFMKLYENLSEESLLVKDVMRTLSYTYWTNVILQNHHFLTPFLTLFRQIFSDFWKILKLEQEENFNSIIDVIKKVKFDDIRTQTSENATSLFGPRISFGTLFWWITIAHNMAKLKIVIFFVNTNVKAIIAMMMSLSN